MNLFELVEDYQKQFPGEDVLKKLCLFSLEEIETALKNRDGKRIDIESDSESLDKQKIVYISPDN